MRTIETIVYTYDELTPAAQEKARDWFRTLDCIDTDAITSDMEYTLNEAGYKDAKAYWSLSYCQGDGVAFETTLYGADVLAIAERVCDDKTFRRFKRLVALSGVTLTIKHHGRYYHWNSMNVTLDIHTSYSASVERLASVVERLIADDVQTLSRHLERQGYDAIEYYYSDECVVDTIRANEYEFTSDGTSF